MNMLDKDLITDVEEAVAVIETYKLTGLVWAFEDCPLKEILHYVPRGKEELVVVSHKDDKYLSYRLVFAADPEDIDPEDFRITLSFHSDYNIHIILSTGDE